MSGLPSLNAGITAAWNTNAPPQKKRTRRALPLNDAPATDSPLASPAPAQDAQPTPPPPRRKRPRPDPSMIAAKYAPPALDLGALGGLQPQITQLLEIAALALFHPEIYLHTGVPRPKGVLLHGVPGGGKTQLVRCLAGEIKLPFISVSAPSIVSGMSGESEKTLRDTFDEAKKIAPCILFLDEVDAITPKRENAQREMERRIVAQLLTCMDDLAASEEPVIIIGATNRPDSLDPALRRAGRFDHEIEMGVPSQEGREQILKVLCSKLRLSGDVDFRQLAKATPGYIGADLTALTTEAGVIAVKRIFDSGTGNSTDPAGSSEQGTISEPDGAAMEAMAIDDRDTPFANLPEDVKKTPIAKFLISHPTALTSDQLSTISLTPADFLAALKIVQPSAKREGFATIPDVTWSDIGALSQTRDELHMAIVQPIRHPELFSVVGIDAPSGVLLWGPPGCGKTLLAKAVANESRANFISVKGPELLNKYVGESERAVRQVFARARSSSPCVIFFDELDALVPRRDDSMSESSARVVNTLLTELDGLDARKAVYVIGATNRPDMIDPAMVRPGRLDKLLYVDLPSPFERFEILKTHTKKTPINDDSWQAIKEIVASDKCDGFSGADIAALVREAATLALRAALESIGAFEAPAEAEPEGVERKTDSVRVTAEHFARAAQKTLPSVSREQRLKYERMRDKYAGVPTRGRRQREAEAEAASAAAATATAAKSISAGGVGTEARVEGEGMDVDEMGGARGGVKEKAFVA
ncbi:ribosome biogenesis ATPase [Cryptococcus neoformans]|nr:ribosome biogenesis ATPase [Cryptococcus neoformans var. grubii]OXC65080.1 ribosome biogenesis ATPase [Cryptococcus neoformans var. grubii MW-RSA852]